MPFAIQANRKRGTATRRRARNDNQTRRLITRLVVLIGLLLVASCTVPLSCFSGCFTECASTAFNCGCGNVPPAAPNAKLPIKLPQSVADILTMLSDAEQSGSAPGLLNRLLGEASDALSSEYTQPHSCHRDCLAVAASFAAPVGECRNSSDTVSDLAACIEDLVASDARKPPFVDYCIDKYNDVVGSPPSQFADCLVYGEWCFIGQLNQQQCPMPQMTDWRWMADWNQAHSDDGDFLPGGLFLGYQGIGEPSLLVFKYPNKLAKIIGEQDYLVAAAVPEGKGEEQLSLVRSLLPFRSDMGYVNFQLPPIELEDEDRELTMTPEGLSTWIGKADITPRQSAANKLNIEGLDLEYDDLILDRTRGYTDSERDRLIGIRLRLDKLHTQFHAVGEVFSGWVVVGCGDVNYEVDNDVSLSAAADVSLDFLIDEDPGEDGGMVARLVAGKVYWRTESAKLGSESLNSSRITNMIQDALAYLVDHDPEFAIGFDDRIVEQPVKFIVDDEGETRTLFSAIPAPQHFLNVPQQVRDVTVAVNDDEVHVRPYVTIREHEGDEDSVLFEGRMPPGSHGLVLPSRLLSSASGSEFSIEVTPICVNCGVDPLDALPFLEFPVVDLPDVVNPGDLLYPPEIDFWHDIPMPEELTTSPFLVTGESAQDFLRPPTVLHRWALQYPRPSAWIAENMPPEIVADSHVLQLSETWDADESTVVTDHRLVVVQLALQTRRRLIMLPFRFAVPESYPRAAGFDAVRPVWYRVPTTFADEVRQHPVLEHLLDVLGHATPVNLVLVPSWHTCGPELVRIYPDLVAKDFQPIGAEVEIIESRGVAFRRDDQGRLSWNFDSPRIIMQNGMVSLENSECEHSMIRFRIRPVQTFGVVARTAQKTYFNPFLHKPSVDLSTEDGVLSLQATVTPFGELESALELPVLNVMAAAPDLDRGFSLDPWMYDAWDVEREKTFEFGIDHGSNTVVLQYPLGAGLLDPELRRLQITKVWMSQEGEMRSVDNSPPDYQLQELLGGNDQLLPGSEKNINIQTFKDLATEE